MPSARSTAPSRIGWASRRSSEGTGQTRPAPCLQRARDRGQSSRRHHPGRVVLGRADAPRLRSRCPRLSPLWRPAAGPDYAHYAPSGGNQTYRTCKTVGRDASDQLYLIAEHRRDQGRPRPEYWWWTDAEATKLLVVLGARLGAAFYTLRWIGPRFPGHERARKSRGATAMEPPSALGTRSVLTALAMSRLSAARARLIAATRAGYPDSPVVSVSAEY
jgi:hypothetical protein